MVDGKSRGQCVSTSFEGRNDAVDILALKGPLQSADAELAHYPVRRPIEFLLQPRLQLCELGRTTVEPIAQSPRSPEPRAIWALKKLPGAFETGIQSVKFSAQAFDIGLGILHCIGVLKAE
jgi:hypothetical protein